MADDLGDYMLTTIDNPWNPYTDWDAWYAYDLAKGYDTPGYLARICKFSIDLSDEDQNIAISNAIDEILMYNILGIYRKVTRPGKNSEVTGTGEGVSRN